MGSHVNSHAAGHRQARIHIRHIRVLDVDRRSLAWIVGCMMVLWMFSYSGGRRFAECVPLRPQTWSDFPEKLNQLGGNPIWPIQDVGIGRVWTCPSMLSSASAAGFMAWRAQVFEPQKILRPPLTRLAMALYNPRNPYLVCRLIKAMSRHTVLAHEIDAFSLASAMPSVCCRACMWPTVWPAPAAR